jgi:hypothetical protein
MIFPTPCDGPLSFKRPLIDNEFGIPTLTHQNSIHLLLLDYKITLPKYNVINTLFVLLYVCILRW